MVGREAELQSLRAVFAMGADGMPQIALISGEAGVGKTRLITEFLEEISAAPQDRPVAIAIGQCIEIGDIGAPFAPVRRILRALLLAFGDEALRDAAGTTLATRILGALVPELASDAENTPDVPPEFVAEAIERLLTALSTTHHLVLVFEDLHWADSATLALLKSLSVTMGTGRVTTLISYRSEETRRGNPLHELLHDLRRNRAVIDVPVAPLDPQQAMRVAKMVRADLGHDQAAVIATRSEGVPFLIEELAELDVDAPLPATLRDLVLARYERLGPTAARVVATVAAGGVQVDDDLVTEVYDGDPSELRAGLREAIEASVLVSDGDGYRFRHALIREAVHEDLLPGERVEWHARYAAALDRRVSAGAHENASALAEHWLHARQIPNAFDATVIARNHANDAFAPITAASLGDRLLELWPHVPDAQMRAGLSRAALALEIAMNYEDGGERDMAMRVAEAGVAFAEPGERLLRASLLYEFGSRLRSSGHREHACEVLLTARGLLDPESEPGERAMLARIDAMRVLIDPKVSSTAMATANRAVTLAEASGDNAALAMALFTRRDLFSDAGDLDRAEADLRRAANLHAGIRTHLQAMVNLTGHCLLIGAYDEGLELGRRAVGEAALAGQERGLGAFLSLNLAETEIDLGDVETGITRAEQALPFLPTSPYFQNCLLLLIAMATLWDDRANQSQALRDRERVGDVTGIEEAVARRVLLDGYAALSSATPQHRIADADDLAERVATVLDWEHPGQTEHLLPMAGWLVSHDSSVRDVLASSLEHALALPDAGPHSHALKALAVAFTDDTAAAWHDALTRAEEGRIPNRYVHLARFRLAQALLTDGERARAQALLEQVIIEAPIDGASLVARWARELATRARLTPRGADVPHPASAPSSLTPREREVLALVAEGFTNSQIAKHLYISPKTVSIHVSAILAKIGAANRTEAATWYATESSLRLSGDRTPHPAPQPAR